MKDQITSAKDHGLFWRLQIPILSYESTCFSARFDAHNTFTRASDSCNGPGGEANFKLEKTFIMYELLSNAVLALRTPARNILTITWLRDIRGRAGTVRVGLQIQYSKPFK